MQRIILYILLCCYSPVLFSGTSSAPVDQLINDFLSTDWPTVFSAKEKLENMGSISIPSVLGIMDDCRIHKLQNTGDLIYPGAEKYYGHGQIIDYDIDDVCVRAGWLLEELTFCDFGFTGIHLPDNELLDFIKNNFTSYYNNPANQKQLDELTIAGKRKLIRTLSIQQAKEWWGKASEGWSRLNAIEEALKSQDEKRIVKALFYLRNGKTLCKGLTKNFYKTRLESRILQLSKHELNRVSENAKLILLDNDFDWLSIKTVD
jgi:hypothetical protein